jgi:hypothetical protein
MARVLGRASRAGKRGGKRDGKRDGALREGLVSCLWMEFVRKFLICSVPSVSF